MLFRARIALLSLVLSGVLLVGFGVFFLAIIQRVGLERVDREIRALAESQLHGSHPRDHWEEFDRSLRFIYGEESSDRLAVQVRNARGEVLFTSTTFPEEIAAVGPPVLEHDEPPPEPGSAGGRRAPGEPRGGAPSGESFVTRLDRDGDGRVSVDEFDGPRAHFVELDTSGDGLLDRREADEAARQLHGARARPPRDSAAPAAPPPGLPTAPGGRPSPPRQKLPVFRTVTTSTGSWRVGFLGNEYVTLTVGLDLADLWREAGRFRKTFLIATPLALLVLGAVGWLLAQRALRPVAAITRTAASMTTGKLDRRVPAAAADRELAALVEVINGMLERLERSFHQAARFSADAAHELQTPLTVLQGELDNAIQGAAPGSPEQRRYSSLLEEVRRLKAVVQKLLVLARADAGRLALRLERIDLARMLESAIEDVEIMAPEIQLESDIAPAVRVMADRDLLGQVLLNLTSNAVKHGRQDGLVRFELGTAGGVARLTVANSGEPIPPAERERIFDRFYRLDESRGGGAGGAGLGLSLAREIARAHGGDLALGPERSGMTTFVLTLPAAPRDES